MELLKELLRKSLESLNAILGIAWKYSDPHSYILFFMGHEKFAKYQEACFYFFKRLLGVILTLRDTLWSGFNVLATFIRSISIYALERMGWNYFKKSSDNSSTEKKVTFFSKTESSEKNDNRVMEAPQTPLTTPLNIPVKMESRSAQMSDGLFFENKDTLNNPNSQQENPSKYLLLSSLEKSERPSTRTSPVLFFSLEKEARLTTSEPPFPWHLFTEPLFPKDFNPETFTIEVSELRFLRNSIINPNYYPLLPKNRFITL